jgi:hypothetical protein
VDFAACEHVGELMTDQFTDSKLTLRAAAGPIAILLTCHFHCRHARACPAHLDSICCVLVIGIAGTNPA